MRALPSWPNQWLLSPAAAPATLPALQLSMRVQARFVKDVLNGDDTTEMRVTLEEVLAESAGKDYRDE